MTHKSELQSREREADAMAGDVLSRPARTAAIKPLTFAGMPSMTTSGQPLDEATRAEMEPRFGHDFGRVRVHSDARAAKSARDLDALAYTLGPNIVVGRDSPAPTHPAAASKKPSRAKRLS